MARKTLFEKDLTPQLHATLTNSKLGGAKADIMGISYMPSNTPIYFKNGVLLTDCKGTCNKVNCEGCKGSCYANRTVIQYEGACINRIENTMHLRKDITAHFEAIYQEAITRKVKTIRYTESGEIESYKQFTELVNLANRLPNVNIYCYTKAYQYLRRYFNGGNELPNNLVILVSVWGDIGVDEYNEFKEHNNIKCFVVNNDTIKVDAICPAYRKDENGKVHRVKSDAVKCGNCGLCTGKRHGVKVIGCLEH